MEQKFKLLIIHNNDGEIVRVAKVSNKFKGTIGFTSSKGGTTTAAVLPELTSTDFFEQLQEIKRRYKVELPEVRLTWKD